MVTHDPETLINAVVCAVIFIRVFSFRRNGTEYVRWGVYLAWGLMFATGSVAIRIIYAKPGSVISALGLGGGLADVALLLNGAVIAQTDPLNDDPLGNGRGVSIPTTPFNISVNVENYLTLRIKNIGRGGNWISYQLQCAITLSRATPNIVFLV
jgi:hypothetical protein